MSRVRLHRREVRVAATIGLLVFVAAALGCDGGGEPVLNFNRFVKQQLANTSETAEPVPINDVTFRSTAADERPDAFDDVLGLSGGG